MDRLTRPVVAPAREKLRLRHPVAAWQRSSRLILALMHAGVEHDDRISPPTHPLLIAFLSSAIVHALAITLFEPGITPAPASTPLRLVISPALEAASAAPPPRAIPDDRVPGLPDKALEPAPKPVIKQARRLQPPRPHPRTTAAPTDLKTPPVTHERLTVAASPPSLATPTAVTTTTVAPPSREVEYLYNPPPDYPRRARRLGLEGEVVIRTRVLPNGESDELLLEQSSGHALLDQAAMEAVRKWRFRPARRGDEQIVSWVEIPVRFRLEH